MPDHPALALARTMRERAEAATVPKHENRWRVGSMKLKGEALRLYSKAEEESFARVRSLHDKDEAYAAHIARNDPPTALAVARLIEAAAGVMSRSMFIGGKIQHLDPNDTQGGFAALQSALDALGELA